ncbi:hypothetical protein HAX54_022875 [Datura stramonium]|uniref:Uncharacterized protein n=1 Tax=Datura stramonium TaxID=4076 RepID=A0ABS8UWZ5_DATST|nr:hypothetical protein [Datura stramonium]
MEVFKIGEEFQWLSEAENKLCWNPKLELGGFFRGVDGWDNKSSCHPTSHGMIRQVCRVEERVYFPVVTMSACDESLYHLMTRRVLYWLGSSDCKEDSSSGNESRPPVVK